MSMAAAPDLLTPWEMSVKALNSTTWGGMLQSCAEVKVLKLLSVSESNWATAGPFHATMTHSQCCTAGNMAHVDGCSA